MKKIKQLLLLVVCVFMLSGCVKEHFSMTINKDKSMNLEVEALVSDKFMEQMNSSEDSEFSMTDDASSLEKQGFTVSPKSENGYSGYVVSKKFNNIDDLSKNTGEEVNLSNITTENFDTSKLFKVEKGFLKNTYTAKFVFEFNQDGLNGGSEGMELNDSDMVPTTDTVEKTDDEALVPSTDAVENSNDTLTTGSDDGMGDMSGLMSLAGEMEFTYKVNLPYAAKSNNATNASSDKKSLTWNLATSGKSNIEFTFEMYNLTNVIIVAAGVVALIVIIIVIIAISSKKKKGAKETLIHTDYDSSIVGKIDETANTPQDQISQGPVNHEFVLPESTPVQPQVNATVNNGKETPTMMGSVSNQPQMPQTNQFVGVEPNVTQGPVVEPTMNQGVELDIPNMTPLSDINQNNING